MACSTGLDIGCVTTSESTCLHRHWLEIYTGCEVKIDVDGW